MTTTAVVRCPDSRNILDGVLMDNLEDYPILDIPAITGTVDDLDHFETLVERHHVEHVIVMTHTQFPTLTKCGGLDAYTLLQQGKEIGLPRLEDWLLQRVFTADPFQHAFDTGQALLQRLPSDIAITIAVFEYLEQQIYPFDHCNTAGKWFSQVSEEKIRENGHIPSSDVLSFMTPEFRWFFERNHEVGHEAASWAEKLRFAENHPLDCLVLNGTPYPPSTYSAFRHAVGNSAFPRPGTYFSVYANPDAPESAVTQLEYAITHSSGPVGVWVIATSESDLQSLQMALWESSAYRDLTEDVNRKVLLYPYTTIPTH